MNGKKFLSEITAILSVLVFVVFGNPCLITAFSESTALKLNGDYYPFQDSDSDLISYGKYYDRYSGETRPQSEIEVNGTDFLSAENGSFSSGKYGSDGDAVDNVLIWDGNSGEVTYGISAEESGIYCLEMTYFPMEKFSFSPQFSISIDGQIPYSTASRITLNTVWTDETEIYTDSKGNQVRPAQVRYGMWITETVKDTDGLFSDPLIFYLEKGSHEVKFTSSRAGFALSKFRFFSPNELPSYSELPELADTDVTVDSTPDNIFRIEGENALYRSDSSISAVYDGTSYLLSPSDPCKVVYNVLGGNWKKANQKAVWKISKKSIKSDGWYRIGVKARQNQMRGFCSCRRIYIDGNVPCRELDSVKFSYSNDWNLTVPSADGEEIYVYLTADRDHFFSMECVAGEIGGSIRRLEDITAELNSCYRKIVMITGTSPDRYTDYYVHEKIPDLIKDFTRISGELKDIQKNIESIADSSGSEASVAETMYVILDKCIEKPLKIPLYLSQIKNSITSVSAWCREYRDQPLEVDYIEFASKNCKFSDCREKLWESIKFSFRAFTGSFFEDYSVISDVKGRGTVNVWVNTGTEQAQIIKEMTENQFMRSTGIPVAVNLVQGGIAEACIAGKEPDIALFIGGEFPVVLASGGLLEPLDGMEGFSDVKSRFQKNALTHYQYMNSTYGIPVTQNFPMMFYRTDILSELGFSSPPETWTQLTDMLSSIQRNYMSAGLVLPSVNISPATETGHTFALLMLQQGLGYYNSEQSETVFDSAKAVQAFEQWTDLYTKYGFEQSYDAFSRFRTGEYPIVISDYTFFNQLDTASPEIKGLWNFCQVPGTELPDGTVSHSANSNVSGAVIFSSSDKKQEAWEFVKWFTGTDAQTEYGIRCEGLFGTLGRFSTANTEALKRLSWSESELERLFSQREELSEIPVLPSSYAVTRNIMNAFRETVNSGENARDSLLWNNRDINYEIARKRQNLGIDDG